MRDLESQLDFQLTAAGIEHEREFRAVPGRRFRWDFRVEDVLIEVQGGIWQKGGHSTGTGITRDCEKANLATINGWRVLLFTGDMVKDGTALDIIRKAMEAG